MEYPIKQKKKLIARSGFTLIETLIAIAILVLAILGPLTVASNSLSTAYYARDQVTAFYLAQEGVEYMRQLRDNNSIAGTVASGEAWDVNLGDTCSDVPCGFDPYPSGNQLFPCASINICLVQYDSATGLYRQQANGARTFEATNFKRTITVTRLTADEDQISVLVTWNTGNLKSPNNFKVVETLFNWQQGIGQPAP